MKFFRVPLLILAFLLLLWGLVPSALLARNARAGPPKLGSFSAPVTFEVVQGGQTYVFTSPSISFAPKGTESVRTLSGFGTFVLKNGPPPPPPPPVLSVSSAAPSPVASGGLFTITGTGFTTSATVFWGGMLLPSAFLSATQMTATAPLVLVTTPAPLVVTVGTQTAQGPSLTVTGGIVPPPPPPGKLVDVHTLGVRGDGFTIDRTALNAAIQNAAPNTTLFFPAGTYLTDDALKVYRNDIGFLGVGDASIIKSVAGSYHFQIGHGGDVTGISFRNLQLYGTPHQYMADGTSRGGVLNFGGKGVVFDQMLFTGCAEPVLNAGVTGGTYGTVLTNSRILGWGRMAYFANGGDRVSNCKFIQDDPNLMGERSSHAFYIHSGSSDVEVKDTEIANVRKYVCQLYGENDPNPISNVRLLRLDIHDVANGIIFAHGAATAGIVRNALIDGCTIRNVYGGQGIAIKNGQGAVVKNNVITGGISAGISLGVWAPYEPQFNLTDVQVTGNTVRNCDRGIWALNSNGGTFTNCTVTGNLVSGLGNRKDYDITGSGITWTPGLTKPGSKREETRPSDDRSPAAKQVN